jgi:hypothetical protein
MSKGLAIQLAKARKRIKQLEQENEQLRSDNNE